MDRNAKKRKAAPAGSPEGRDAKRQKTPVSLRAVDKMDMRYAVVACKEEAIAE